MVIPEEVRTMQGYTRQQAIRLSGLSSNKLSYLDRLGLVSPQKTGNPKKPACIYTWEQIIQLRTIYRLRQDASMQQVTKTLNFLKSLKIDPSIYNNCLVAFNNEIYCIPNNELEINKMIIQLTGKTPEIWTVQSIKPIAIKDVVSDICHLADENKITIKEREMIEAMSA